MSTVRSLTPLPEAVRPSSSGPEHAREHLATCKSFTLGGTTEPLITLRQAARHYPGHRGADRMHPATLTRWILKGVKGPGGRVVRLEAVRVGSRWLTSEAALTRFATALTPQVSVSDPPTAHTPIQRQRASERAAEALKRKGA